MRRLPHTRSPRGKKVTKSSTCKKTKLVFSRKTSILFKRTGRIFSVLLQGESHETQTSCRHACSPSCRLRPGPLRAGRFGQRGLRYGRRLCRRRQRRHGRILYAGILRHFPSLPRTAAPGRRASPSSQASARSASASSAASPSARRTAPRPSRQAASALRPPRRPPSPGHGSGKTRWPQTAHHAPGRSRSAAAHGAPCGRKTSPSFHGPSRRFHVAHLHPSRPQIGKALLHVCPLQERHGQKPAPLLRTEDGHRKNTARPRFRMSGNGALRIPSTTEIPAEGHNHAKGTPLFLLMQKRPDRTEAYPAWREKKRILFRPSRTRPGTTYGRKTSCTSRTRAPAG